MEFESQGNTEACLSENFVEFVDDFSVDQVQSDKNESFCNNQVLIVDSRPQKVTDGAAISNLASRVNCKLGIPNSCSSKALLPDDSSFFRSCSFTDLPRALISEIFNRLDPKELGIVSCVSTNLHRVASEHHVWKDFYCERWGAPSADEKTWRDRFVEREFRSKTFLGRYSIEMLYGHTESVRTVFLLASAKLLFTSGYDCSIRMWNIEEGLSIASSLPLGCTIRAVSADTKLLVAGGTDGFIECWAAVVDLPYLFDLQNQSTMSRVWEHTGPVSCLALDFTRIYSGSWDMTVRIWDRASLKCLNILKHQDWVWCLAPHDTTVACASGSDIYVWDIHGETPRAAIWDVHKGETCALARSRTGNLLFTGGADGAIRMLEITSNGVEKNVSLVATWIPHIDVVHSLAFEFPWLVSASSDGMLSLIDVQKLLKWSSRKHLLGADHGQIQGIEPPQRMLQGLERNILSVCIGVDRIVCGGEGGVVWVFNFSRALEIQQTACALRGIRMENRMRRRQLQMEMNSKGGRGDRCAVDAKKRPMNGDRGSSWRGKHVVSGKPNA